MAVVRCWECRGFCARIRGEVTVIAVIDHSDQADERHDVVPCRRCGALHEVKRGNGEEAA